MKSLLNLSALLSLLLLLSCGKSPERQAQDLVARSVKAHGGSENWEQMSSLKFRRSTRLMAEDGSLKSESSQLLEFRFKPYFEGKMSWSKDSIDHVATWDGAQMRYLMGENEVKNPGFLAAKKKDLDAVFSAVAMPWRLEEGGSRLSYEGRKTLENGLEVEAVRADFGPDAEAWFYYFDPESYVMVASEVQKGEQRNLIYHLGLTEIEGLKLQDRRETWSVDEEAKRLRLNAEYLFFDYQIIK
jgi:hypothetical protein